MFGEQNQSESSSESPSRRGSKLKDPLTSRLLGARMGIVIGGFPISLLRLHNAGKSKEIRTVLVHQELQCDTLNCDNEP